MDPKGDGMPRGPAAYRRDDGPHEKPLPLDLSHHFSEVTKRRTASKIKEAYKFFQIPGILNIAGGLPNVRFFPFDTLEAQAAKPQRWPAPSPDSALPSSPESDPAAAAHIAVPKAVDESDPLKKIDLATALQYGLAGGYPPLLQWVREFTRNHLHPDVPYRDGPEVVLTCGSTDGFSKCLNMFINPWTEGVDDIRDRPGLLCETYVYTGATNQAAPMGVQIVAVKADEGGMLAHGPGGLEDVLENWDWSKGRRPNLMYTVTLGHNPTGIVLSLPRKREIYAVCSKYDVIIVEDEPYWYLQFPSADRKEALSRGEPDPGPGQNLSGASGRKSSGYPFLDSLTPSFLSIDVDGRVVRLDTFSKTVAPGCRLGWITAQPVLAERFYRISEATTQQPSGFVQSLIAELIMGPSPSSSTSTGPAPTPSLLSSLLNRPPPPSDTESTITPGWQSDGWVRWLEGLRAAYESRMVRTCRILDAATYLATTTSPSDGYELITKTKLFSYRWPRGGMFIWLRLHLESHPLWLAPRLSDPTRLLDGPAMAAACMVFLTTEPFRVLVSTGSIFSANPAVAISEGWANFRLCFAAEAEDKVDVAAHRFVAGLREFWAVRDVAVVERLLKEVGALEAAVRGGERDMFGLAGSLFGC